MSVTNNEIIEAFLLDCDSVGQTSFNVAAATQWINMNYSRPAGPWTNGDVSHMIQNYCHSQRNLTSKRAGTFKPSFVIDPDKRGGRNAIWSIHQNATDAKIALRRTARDLADISVNRMIERTNPTLAKDPAVQATLKPFIDAMEANLVAISSLTKSMP